MEKKLSPFPPEKLHKWGQKHQTSGGCNVCLGNSNIKRKLYFNQPTSRMFIDPA